MLVTVKPSFIPFARACTLLACALAACSVIGGCRSAPPMPAHDWPGYREALRFINERHERIDTISAAFDMTIRQDDGRSGRLEGALVAQRPDAMRIQAWRFHRELMDLTRRPDGTWLWTAERVEELEQQLAHPDAHRIGWFQALFITLDPDEAELIDEGSETEPMVVRVPFAGAMGAAEADDDGWTVRAKIDRPTLTVRQMTFLNKEGNSVQTVALERYEPIGELAFPMRIEMVGHWRMTLRLSDVALNDELPAAVFEPPTKAKRLTERRD